MTILYIHQYFKTPNEPGGTRSYWIAKKMIEKGINVIMITCTNDTTKKGKVIIVDSIEVHYLDVEYDQTMGIISRLYSFLKFMTLSLWHVIKFRSKYHKIYATSTPLTVGIPALFAKHFLKKAFIFEVRDLWPEVPIQLGVIKNRFLIHTLRALEKAIYVHAEKVIALSPGMLAGVISRNVSKKKVFMIPNMSKPEHFYPREYKRYYFESNIISEDKLTVIYFGSIGKTNGLEKVIKFFGDVEYLPIELIIAGEGSEKKALEKIVKTKSYNNVSFVGNYNMFEISELVNNCDLSLVSFDNVPILSTNSPNKLFDSLSAGKPIIVNSDGWTKDLVVGSKCGFYYEYESFESFKKMILQILGNKKHLVSMGRVSRELSLTRYNQEILSEKVVNQI